MRIKELLEEITPSNLLEIERFANGLWQKLGIDVEFSSHFLTQANHERNGEPVTKNELISMFKKQYKYNGKDISKLGNIEAVMKDLLTDINLPFVIRDTDHGKTLFAKTVMRKKDFFSPDEMFKVN